MKLIRKIKLVGYFNVREAQTYFEGGYGIRLTALQIEELALKYMPLICSFWQDMIEDDLLGGGEEQGGGEVSIDTATGENLADALCQKLMKRNWPTYGEDNKMTKKQRKSFWTDFRNKLIENGYK